MAAPPITNLNDLPRYPSRLEPTGHQNRYDQAIGGKRRVVAYAENGVLLLILVLMINTLLAGGVFCPIRVVGPSMIPAFSGPRVKLTCPQCGFSQFCCAVTQSCDECWERAVCPNCGTRLAQFRRSQPNDAGGPRVISGDRVVILKGLWGEWRRWDVVAFHNVGERGGLTVKRIVGLPGETIEIRDGVLFVSGCVEPRPWEVQRSVRTLVCSPRVLQDSVIQLEAGSQGPQLRMQAIEHPATTYCYYHPALDQEEKPTRNLILSFRLTACVPGTRLRIRSDFGDGHFDVILSLPSQYAIKRIQGGRGDSALGEHHASGVLPSSSGMAEYAISLVDRRFLLVVNDRVVAKLPYLSGPLATPIPRPFEIIVEQGSATLTELRLWKVSPYSDTAPSTQQLSGYYLLGDDPHVSIDSRHFGVVSGTRIIGRVLKWPF